MARPARAVIDLSAFENNYRVAQQLAGNGSTVAVVKANAYGHGATVIACHLNDAVDMYGVASIDEAEGLREAGVTAPILLMEGCFDATEWLQAVKLKMDVVVHHELQLSQLQQLPSDHQLTVWLKIDTGMHRLGFALEELESRIQQLTCLPQVEQIIVMTHLADADVCDSYITSDQITAFRALVERYQLPVSIANSAGLLDWPAARMDWNRPGLLLYGVAPNPKINTASLTPVMSLTSSVIALRRVKLGDAVGYNSRWTAKRDSVVATIAMGYGDGYPRNAQDGTPVIVNGQRVPLVGRVSMDMMTVDVTDIAKVSVGDHVELWGRQLSVAEVSRYCDSNSYEMLTRVADRVKRVYVSDSDANSQYCKPS